MSKSDAKMDPQACAGIIGAIRFGTRFRHRHKHKFHPEGDHKVNLKCGPISDRTRSVFNRPISSIVLILISSLILKQASLQLRGVLVAATTRANVRAPSVAHWSGVASGIQITDNLQILASESKTRKSNFQHPHADRRLEPVAQTWPAAPMIRQYKKVARLSDRPATTRSRTYQDALLPVQRHMRRSPSARSINGSRLSRPLSAASTLAAELVARGPEQWRKQRSSMEPSVSAEMNRKCGLILQRTYVRRLATNEVDGETEQDNPPVEPTGRTEQVCISYDDVNRAIEEAKRRRGFKMTAELKSDIDSIEPAPEHIAQLGELSQEVTKILTSRYDLSPDEILNGLPLIDMSRTSFWQICPLMVKPIQCDSTGRFRSFTGHCNNLDNPIWGAARTPFVRYLEPKHPDGIEQDRVSALDASPLPAPRLVTSQVHRDVDRPSSELTLLIMVWGQFVDHDVAQAAPPRSKYPKRAVR